MSTTSIPTSEITRSIPNHSPPSARPAATIGDISDYVSLVHRIAAGFMRRLPRSIQRDDLVAAGTLGLFHALRSTTHTSPAMFVAYASIRIRGAMVDELRRSDWSPRRRKSPRSTKESTPSNVTSITAGRASGSLPPERPSVAVVGFDDLPVGALAALAEQGRSPLEDALVQRDREELHAAMEELPERERDIVQMRYFQGMPCKAIAQTLGLSEARISQLHSRATRRLREILAVSVEEMKLAG